MARKPQRATTTTCASGTPHLMSAEIVVQFATLKRCTTARPSAPSPPKTNTMGDLLVAAPLRRPTAAPANAAACRFARARRNQVARAAIYNIQPYLALQLPAHAVVTLCGASPPHEVQRTGKQRWVYPPVSLEQKCEAVALFALALPRVVGLRTVRLQGAASSVHWPLFKRGGFCEIRLASLHGLSSCGVP
jgi:hypothetical protein